MGGQVRNSARILPVKLTTRAPGLAICPAPLPEREIPQSAESKLLAPVVYLLLLTGAIFMCSENESHILAPHPRPIVCSRKRVARIHRVVRLMPVQLHAMLWSRADGSVCPLWSTEYEREFENAGTIRAFVRPAA